MIAETVNSVLSTLEQDGIVILPDFLTPNQLRSMKTAFEICLQHMRWNDVDGYEKTELFRENVEDVLTLDQAFVDVAICPLVTEVLREYIGPRFELVEARGWKSLPTRLDFHGWHGDAWYDQQQVSYIPREVKLGVYLTDVRTGFFEYVKGSHRKAPPRYYRNTEVADIAKSNILQVEARAGSAFLFDTSGIHRQSVPILEPRYAAFYNYHDPSIPLQKEDVAYYRYRPLLLNAAFLGGLSAEDQRILGFGNKQNHMPGYIPKRRHPGIHKLLEVIYGAKLRYDSEQRRVAARLRRIFRG